MIHLYDGLRFRAPEYEPAPAARSDGGFGYLGIGTAILTIVALAFWLTLGSVLAQETPPAEDTSVGIGWVFTTAWPWIEKGVALGVAAIVTFAASAYARVSGRQLDQQHRDALNAALKTGALNVLGNFKGKLEDLRIEVRSKLIRDILRYAELSVPEAIAWLKPSPEIIEAKANAALVETAAQVGKAANDNAASEAASAA